MPKIDKDCVRQYEILKIAPKLIKIVFVSYVLFYARTWKIKQPKIAPKIDKDCVSFTLYADFFIKDCK